MRSSHPSTSREENAVALVSQLFHANGWEVARYPTHGGKHSCLMVQKGPQRIAVEIKAPSEGRADRVIPLLSQAILQAQVHALDAGSAQPLAIISVENASQSLSKQVGSFVEQYAPKVAAGLISNNGLRYFRGAGLENLNTEPDEPRRHGSIPSGQLVNLFSDLNQWMLKVLLAPEFHPHLLESPRGRYRNGSELASAAQVSPMSTSRFLQQLRKEGYLDDSSRYLTLVRRAELFQRWKAAAMRPSPELPMRFVIRAPVLQQIKGLLARLEGKACIGLFAAADALQIGHVSGVPPYLYASKLPRPDDKNWRGLVAATPSEKPDLIVRQALSPKSTFRGAIHQDGLIVADVIQVWLDVANHPARGEEQADLIYQKTLRPIIENGY